MGYTSRCTRPRNTTAHPQSRETQETLMRISKLILLAFASLVLVLVESRMSAAQVVATLFTFDGTQGFWPDWGAFVQGRDGLLYGTTFGGGTGFYGTVFKQNIDGTHTVLHNFSGPEGANPVGGVTLARDGNFYGTTQGGRAVN